MIHRLLLAAHTKTQTPIALKGRGDIETNESLPDTTRHAVVEQDTLHACAGDSPPVITCKLGAANTQIMRQKWTR